MSIIVSVTIIVRSIYLVHQDHQVMLNLTEKKLESLAVITQQEMYTEITQCLHLMEMNVAMAAAALSRGDGRWWAIPLGVVVGSAIGCDAAGG